MANALMAVGLLMLPLSGCPFLPHPDVSVSPGIPCTVGPPPLSAADQLSDQFGIWVVGVAKTGEKICGWQPPGGK